MKSSRIASTAIVLAFSTGTALAADFPSRKVPVYMPRRRHRFGPAFTAA
jgi:hypothetical protein